MKYRRLTAMTNFRPFKSPILKYAAIAILPLAALIFQPAAYITVLFLGDRILLETEPVDPRDFLRGDYVVLNYKISTPDEFLFEKGLLDDENLSYFSYSAAANKPVYVALGLDGRGEAFVLNVSSERPAGRLYLRGTLRLSSWSSPSIDYGLGAYYVPEGTGGDLERAIRGGDETVLADVRVLGGHGVIKELLRER
jgi:uncharacterized membrane-anchored protein